jgi:hypothetical protein
VKKLISIGVALALLTMAVVPAAVAADPVPDLCASNYTEPCTYAKTPFAIIASGFVMLSSLWTKLDTPAALDMGMPWLSDVFTELAYYTYGPLSWTVDMLAWGINLGGDIVGQLGGILEAMNVDLPIEMTDVGAILETVACGMRECFTDVCYNVTWNCTKAEGTFPCCP